MEALMRVDDDGEIVIMILVGIVITLIMIIIMIIRLIMIITLTMITESKKGENGTKEEVEE